MRIKHSIPAIVAGALIGSTAVVPAVMAGEDKSPTTMEQRADSAQSALKDAWLDGKLESALLFNGHLNSFHIDTEVKSGIAYLDGTVESDIDRDLAGEIAKSIDGVREVKNRLNVDSSMKTRKADTATATERQSFKQAVSNATMTARVKSQLLVNGNTKGLAINVDSADGHVVLSGKVDSDQERELAEKIAGNTEGVINVDNRLLVKNDS